MTETDNRKVKEHIEPNERNTDEFLTSIQTLYLNERDNRNLFAKRSIQPNIELGVFNSYTKKYESCLGKTDIQYSTASAATNTLTCPPGHKYIVSVAIGYNPTSPGAFSLTGTINGTAISILPSQGLYNTNPRICIGTPSSIDDAVATYPSINAKITLYPGDSLTITSAGYVALDATEYTWIFEDVLT